MQTYTTLDGTVLDLTDASDEERGYFDRCIMAYRAGMAWEDFTMLAGGLANPLIRATDGLITRAIYDTPLYQAARDLEDRLGIQQECLAPDRLCLKTSRCPKSQRAASKVGDGCGNRFALISSSVLLGSLGPWCAWGASGASKTRYLWCQRIDWPC